MSLAGCASLSGDASEQTSFDPGEQQKLIRQRQLAEREAPPPESAAPTVEGAIRRGDTHRGDGAVAEAMFAYLQAHQLDPDDPTPVARIASLQLTSDPERAERIFRELVETHPESGAAHTGLGLALIEAGRWSDAREALDRALAIDPRSAAAHSALGVCLDRLGRPGEAREAYARATTLQPEYYEALNNLGVSHLMAGEFARAEQVLRRAASLQKRDPAVLNNLGLALGRMERYDDALKTFERVGSAQAARNNLGYVYFLNGHYEKAIREYERALLADGDQRLSVLRNLDAARRAERSPDSPSPASPR